MTVSKWTTLGDVEDHQKNPFVLDPPKEEPTLETPPPEPQESETLQVQEVKETIRNEVNELRLQLQQAIDTLPNLSDDQESIRALQALKDELNKLERSFLVRLGTVLVNPIEAYGIWKEKKKQEAYEVPDNPKLLAKLKAILTSDFQEWKNQRDKNKNVGKFLHKVEVAYKILTSTKREKSEKWVQPQENFDKVVDRLFEVTNREESLRLYEMMSEPQKEKHAPKLVSKLISFLAAQRADAFPGNYMVTLGSQINILKSRMLFFEELSRTSPQDTFVQAEIEKQKQTHLDVAYELLYIKKLSPQALEHLIALPESDQKDIVHFCQNLNLKEWDTILSDKQCLTIMTLWRDIKWNFYELNISFLLLKQLITTFSTEQLHQAKEVLGVFPQLKSWEKLKELVEEAIISPESDLVKKYALTSDDRLSVQIMEEVWGKDQVLSNLRRHSSDTQENLRFQTNSVPGEKPVLLDELLEYVKTLPTYLRKFISSSKKFSLESFIKTDSAIAKLVDLREQQTLLPPQYAEAIFHCFESYTAIDSVYALNGTAPISEEVAKNFIELHNLLKEDGVKRVFYKTGSTINDLIALNRSGHLFDHTYPHVKKGFAVLKEKKFPTQLRQFQEHGRSNLQLTDWIDIFKCAETEMGQKMTQFIETSSSQSQNFFEYSAETPRYNSTERTDFHIKELYALVPLVQEKFSVDGDLVAEFYQLGEMSYKALQVILNGLPEGSTPKDLILVEGILLSVRKFLVNKQSQDYLFQQFATLSRSQKKLYLEMWHSNPDQKPEVLASFDRADTLIKLYDVRPIFPTEVYGALAHDLPFAKFIAEHEDCWFLLHNFNVFNDSADLQSSKKFIRKLFSLKDAGLDDSYFVQKDIEIDGLRATILDRFLKCNTSKLVEFAKEVALCFPDPRVKFWQLFGYLEVENINIEKLRYQIYSFEVGEGEFLKSHNWEIEDEEIITLAKKRKQLLLDVIPREQIPVEVFRKLHIISEPIFQKILSHPKIFEARVQYSKDTKFKFSFIEKQEIPISLLENPLFWEYSGFLDDDDSQEVLTRKFTLAQYASESGIHLTQQRLHQFLEIYKTDPSLLTKENFEIFGVNASRIILHEQSIGPEGREQRRDVLQHFTVRSYTPMPQVYDVLFNPSNVIRTTKLVNFSQKSEIKIPFEFIAEVEQVLAQEGQENIETIVQKLDSEPFPTNDEDVILERTDTLNMWHYNRINALIPPETKAKAPQLFKKLLQMNRIEEAKEVLSFDDKKLSNAETLLHWLSQQIAGTDDNFTSGSTFSLNEVFFTLVEHQNFDLFAEHILQEKDIVFYKSFFHSTSEGLKVFLDANNREATTVFKELQKMLPLTFDDFTFLITDPELCTKLIPFLQRPEIKNFFEVELQKNISLADILLAYYAFDEERDEALINGFQLGFTGKVLRRVPLYQLSNLGNFPRMMDYINCSNSEPRPKPAKDDLPLEECIKVLRQTPQEMRFPLLMGQAQQIKWETWEYSKSDLRRYDIGITDEQLLEIEVVIMRHQGVGFKSMNFLRFERFYRAFKNREVGSDMRAFVDQVFQKHEGSFNAYRKFLLDNEPQKFLGCLTQKKADLEKFLIDVSDLEKTKILDALKSSFSTLFEPFFSNEPLLAYFPHKKLQPLLRECIKEAKMLTLIKICELPTVRLLLEDNEKELLVDRALSQGDFAQAKNWVESFYTEKSEQEVQKERIEKYKDTVKKVGVSDSEHTFFYGMYKQEFLSPALSADQLKACRKRIITENHGGTNSIVRQSYKSMLEYLGGADADEEVLWKYMGTRDKHDVLTPVQNFLVQIKDIEGNTGESKKDAVRKMLTLGGMGTGLQANLCKEVMEKITPELWIQLETSSTYPGQEPPLKNIHEMNLARIKNEIRLIQMPQILEAIKKIPPERAALRQYSQELIEHPGINVDAVQRFVEKPSAFFKSRTGAGEDNPVVDMLLTELSPDRYPNWDATASRDALVEGLYDRLNSFPAKAVQWHENERLAAVEAKLLPALFPEEGVMNVKEVVTAIGSEFQGFDSETTKAVAEHQKMLRQELFLEYMEEGGHYDLFVIHAGGKGKDVVKKAYDFLQKRELADIDGLLKRLQQNSEQNAQKIQDLRDRRESMVQKIERERQETGVLLEQLEGRYENLREFWKRIFETGFLDKTDLTHMIKRITKEEYPSETDWMTKLAEQNVAANSILEQQANNMLKAAEQSSLVTWYQMEVLKPSDPETATAGTTTGQCDAFGHGKKSHFMVNPGTAQMVLRESRQGKPREWGEDHIIAQSTLTTDKRIFVDGKQRKVFFDALYKQRGKISEALAAMGTSLTAEQLLELYGRGSDQITLDSVEVPPNIKGRISRPEMHQLLVKGFDRMGEKDTFYGVQVVAGTQYSYMEDKSLPPVANDATWLTPIAYSDNSHDRETAVLIQKGVQTRGREEVTGVRAARPDDAFVIGLMEDIAFSRSGGKSDITGFLAISRELNASCLQAERAGCNPLSFIKITKNEDGSSQYNGYLIAFERGQKEIYITDTATVEQGRGTGRELLYHLLQSVGTDAKLNKKTVTMDCRAATSAKAIAKPTNREMIEEFKFKDNEGKTIQYRVHGPEYTSIQGDGKYPFRFEPYEVKV